MFALPSCQIPSLPTPRRSTTTRPSTSLLAITLTLCCLLLGGCIVISLKGPTIVVIGQLARYSLELESTGDNVTDVTVYVIADVPVDWTLEASAYAGTADGQSVDGMGSVDIPPAACVLPPPAAGYQRVTLSAGPFPLLQFSDTGVAELDFRVAGPEGEYTLSFWTAGANLQGSDCDDKPQTLVIEQIEGLFVDNFETGDTGQWSATVP